MNWSKTVLAGAVAGVVAWLADFVMHGVIMGATYEAHPAVFSQEQASPFLFLADRSLRLDYRSHPVRQDARLLGDRLQGRRRLRLLLGRVDLLSELLRHAGDRGLPLPPLMVLGRDRRDRRRDRRRRPGRRVQELTGRADGGEAQGSVAGRRGASAPRHTLLKSRIAISRASSNSVYEIGTTRRVSRVALVRPPMRVRPKLL